MTPLVPFQDLKAHHAPLREELVASIAAVIDASAFAGGSFVEEFEHAFAASCGVDHVIGVGSGTDALWLALRAAGVGPGDEVVTVGATFFATAEAISLCGATPVFVDVDPETYTLAPHLLAPAITSRTKAVIPVHLYGQVADMDPILAIAAQHRLAVIEDACQAHGATYKGRRAGSLGDFGCFSFYPGKNLGAFGEAGAVVTRDAALAAELRVLRDHGQSKKYHHARIGWNARMDGIQGAVLQQKLPRLAAHNAQRAEHARHYRELLADAPEIALPANASYGAPAHHLFVVRVAQRDAVLHTLAEQGIQCGIHYPVPVHLQPAYRHLGLAPGALPVTEQLSNEALSLPLYPELSPGQVALVAKALKLTVVKHRVRCAAA